MGGQLHYQFHPVRLEEILFEDRFSLQSAEPQRLRQHGNVWLSPVSVQAEMECLLSKVFCPSKACGTRAQRSRTILQKTAVHLPRHSAESPRVVSKPGRNAIFKRRSHSHFSSDGSICRYAYDCSLSYREPAHTCTQRRQRTRWNVTSHLPRVERGGHAVVWRTCCYDNDSSADSIPATCARSCLPESVLALRGNARGQYSPQVTQTNGSYLIHP